MFWTVVEVTLTLGRILNDLHFHSEKMLEKYCNIDNFNQVDNQVNKLTIK